MTTSALYRRFAEWEARGTSPLYDSLATGVSESEEICGLLDGLPAAKRQPNLLFAAVRFLDGSVADWREFSQFVTDRWDDVAAVMAARSTQTNEAGRCGAFLPVLAQFESPIALIEVGASAGLCLNPDRYAYDYNLLPADDETPERASAHLGSSALRIAIDCAGPVPIPTRLPDVRWRAGLDLNPLDVLNTDDMAWLQACIWPEHEMRRERLTAATIITRQDPPPLTVGDLLTDTEALLDDVPSDMIKVLFHSAALAYVDPEQRQAFAAMVRARNDVIWLSNEAPGVIAGVETDAEPPAGIATAARFHLVIGGTRLLALTDPHGNWLSWLS